MIRGEICARGAISFVRFMELALYQPQLGYYGSGRARIGRRGDFFTNVSVGPIFGKLLAAQFAEIWELLECPRDFTIVEQGAHDGVFAADVLLHCRETKPDCFAAATYLIVEPLAILRARQQETLAGFAPKIQWAESVAALDPFTGIHFSNELFDALPVHLLVADRVGWQEKFVVWKKDGFGFVTHDPSRPELVSILPKAAAPGFVAEANLASPALIREIAAKISRGVILTIDYGFSREEFYAPDRSEGTLQVRAQHKKLTSPFDQIGLADISAHVEWTSLIAAGRAEDADILGFTDQHHFLTGIMNGLIETPALENFSLSEKRALQTLLHPEMLGRQFQALALGKNFAAELSGFQFATRRSVPPS